MVVTYLELIGTSLGTWTWQPADPTGLISIGNPPSGIAGGYAFFDAAALFVAPRLLLLWERRRTGQNQPGCASSDVVSRLSSRVSCGAVRGSSQRKK